MPRSRDETRPIVYVVDDDSVIRERVRKLLESLSYEVVCFASAEEMLSRKPLPAPVCLVVEAHLPGMSGVELLEALRRDHFSAPVVVLARGGDVRSAVRALRAGAADFIEKPFLDQVLARSVERVTAAPHGPCRVG